MPIPDLPQLCIDLLVTPGELCVTLPVGADLCVQFPSVVPPTPDELVKMLFGQINTALAPLQPIFNIVDAVVAVFNCVKAISTLDPVEIINCIPNLAQVINQLLKLIPQLSLPILIVQFIDVLIIYLNGQVNQLLRYQAYLERILTAETIALRPGNIALANVITCAKSDSNKLISFMNEQNAPVNRLIGFINLFLKIIGIEPGLPTLGEILPDQVEDTILLIGYTVEALEFIRKLIPVGGSSLPLGGAAPC